ncbi:MAG TPA: carbohydrate ABC transporter permease [Chloroflexota bacterium]
MTTLTHATPRPAAQQSVLSPKARRRLEQALTYGGLTIATLLFLLPLFWMLNTSLKARFEVFVYPPEWIPLNPQWGNYGQALTRVPFGQFALNTSLIALISIVGSVLSCSVTGYSFARLRFPGRRILFGVLIATLMVPEQVTYIPLFVIYRQLGWLDTYLPLTVERFFGNAFLIFLFRQYVMTIPRDLDEAARIDGCGTFGVFYRVLLPLLRPPMILIVVFMFLWVWNDFQKPLIYLTTYEKLTVQIGLAFFRGQYSVEWHLLMAATLVTMLPCLVVYFLAQKHLIGGIASVGLKG